MLPYADGRNLVVRRRNTPGLENRLTVLKRKSKPRKVAMGNKLKKRNVLRVGYKQPPAHTQFQKGKSGNPRGRPKGTFNTASALRKAFAQKLTVTVDGKQRRMTKLDVAAIGFANKSAAGDPRAKADWLKLMLAIDESLRRPSPDDIPPEWIEENLKKFS